MTHESTEHPQANQDLDDLLHDFCDGQIDDEGSEQLMSLLVKSKDARRRYVEFVHLCVELSYASAGNGDPARFIPPEGSGETHSLAASAQSHIDVAPTALPFNDQSASFMADLFCPMGVGQVEGGQVGGSRGDIFDSRGPFGAIRQRFALLLGGVLAVALLISLGGLIGLSQFYPVDSASGVAQDAVATSTSPSLQLSSGTARLDLPDVGYVVLDGPADFRMLGAKRARLTSGRIKLRVTEPAGRGFVVETPYGEITDLGTEFGVDLTEQGKAGVVVFEGAVDLRPGQAPLTTVGQLQRLVDGEGVVFDGIGQLNRINSIVTGNVATFSRSADGFEGSTAPLIVSVSDNLSENTRKFYEIVVGGLREDAVAYVDRGRYQWNGMTEDGMPDYLIGADLIRTFMNDKTRENLGVEVIFGRPARLFVFLDERVPPPEWLLQDFRQLDDCLGLDEIGIGEFRNEHGQRVTFQKDSGVGPGKSIDQTFTIWERLVPRAGAVRLGPPHGRSKQTAMYGIAAIDLESEEEGSLESFEQQHIARQTEPRAGHAAQPAFSPEDKPAIAGDDSINQERQSTRDRRVLR